MKKQKKDKRRQSTQDLLGVKKITDYSLAADPRGGKRTCAGIKSCARNHEGR